MQLGLGCSAKETSNNPSKPVLLLNHIPSEYSTIFIVATLSNYSVIEHDKCSPKSLCPVEMDENWTHNKFQTLPLKCIFWNEEELIEQMNIHSQSQREILLQKCWELRESKMHKQMVCKRQKTELENWNKMVAVVTGRAGKEFLVIGAIDLED